MSKKIRYILIFLLLAFIAAVFAWKYTFKKSELSVASHKTDITIEANVLLKSFETSEDSANRLYLDKIILVTGLVGSVTRDSVGYSVYLREDTAISGVMCSFDRTAFNPELIKVGSQVTIKGICTGYLMDVILTKCSISANPGK
jgi:hypothetical protein